jgi:hypothetical protein
MTSNFHATNLCAFEELNESTGLSIEDIFQTPKTKTKEESNQLHENLMFPILKNIVNELRQINSILNVYDRGWINVFNIKRF